MGWFGPQSGSCSCCGGDPPFSCIILEDDFNRSNSTDLGSDWTEAVGDWSIASNQLATSSAGAIAVTTASRTASSNYIVQATISQNAQIIFDYQDSNNWHAIRYGTDGRFRLYKCTAGTVTFVVIMGLVAGIPSTVNPKICVTGSLVLLNYGTIKTTATITPYDGLKAGIGLAASSITADDFSFKYHKLENTTCDYCTTDCSTCAYGGETLSEYVVDLSNFALTNLGSPSNACERCDEITGEFNVKYTGSCQWGYVESFCSNGCTADSDGSAFSDCASDYSLSVSMTLTNFSGSCELYVFVSMSGVVNPDNPTPCSCPQFTATYKKGLTSFDMINLSETLTLDSSTNEACGGSFPSSITVSAP